MQIIDLQSHFLRDLIYNGIYCYIHNRKTYLTIIASFKLQGLKQNFWCTVIFAHSILINNGNAVTLSISLKNSKV